SLRDALQIAVSGSGGLIWKATKPRARPMKRATKTWVANEGIQIFRRFDGAVVVFSDTEDDSKTCGGRGHGKGHGRHRAVGSRRKRQECRSGCHHRRVTNEWVRAARGSNRARGSDRGADPGVDNLKTGVTGDTAQIDVPPACQSPNVRHGCGR